MSSAELLTNASRGLVNALSTISPQRPRRKAEVEVKAKVTSEFHLALSLNLGLNFSLDLSLNTTSPYDGGIDDAKPGRQPLAQDDLQRDRGDDERGEEHPALHHVRFRAQQPAVKAVASHRHCPHLDKLCFVHRI